MTHTVLRKPASKTVGMTDFKNISEHKNRHNVNEFYGTRSVWRDTFATMVPHRNRDSDEFKTTTVHWCTYVTFNLRHRHTFSILSISVDVTASSQFSRIPRNRHPEPLLQSSRGQGSTKNSLKQLLAHSKRHPFRYRRAMSQKINLIIFLGDLVAFKEEKSRQSGIAMVSCYEESSMIVVENMRA